MGECEETGRLPGEIVEVYRAPRRPGEGRDPREVVEVYRQPDPREVVEIYSRPVPAGRERTASPVRRRRKGGLVRFLICVVLLAGLAGAARWADSAAPWRGKEDAAPSQDEPDVISIPQWPVGQGASLVISRERGEELTAQEIYRRLNPTVVTVQCWTGEGMSIGTGVIFSEDGYVVTNYHVVRGGRDCMAVLNSGYRLSLCYVAGDADSDLAVLKIPPGELLELGELPAAPFGDSEQLVVGDPVYAIGTPRQLQGTLTNGIISAINRDVQVEGRTMTLLQTNAALNSGNSGGPLVNDRGQVVGINVAKYMSGRDSAEGLGFAIPTAQLERVINDLLEWGEVQPEPRLGIWVQTLERGLYVQSVDSDTAAERAGVRAGDYILTAQGEEIHDNQDLFRVRRRLHVGDELALTLLRNGETLDVTLILDEAVQTE